MSATTRSVSGSAAPAALLASTLQLGMKIVLPADTTSEATMIVSKVLGPCIAAAEAERGAGGGPKQAASGSAAYLSEERVFFTCRFVETKARRA